MFLKRYTRPKMGKIWHERNKFNLQLQIEKKVAQIQAELNLIPKEAAIIIESQAKFSLFRIKKLEATLKHETLAFLTDVIENINHPLSSFLHYGLTSSDILDTAFNLQLKSASALLLDDLKQLLNTLKNQAIKHKYTICIGRSHGMHAEPTTFGLKMAVAYAEFQRNYYRLQLAQNTIAKCMISGPMGTYSGISKKVQDKVAQALDLHSDSITTQIIARDHYAEYFAVLAIIASSIERLATEIRNLQRTEINEVSEHFEINQKGSSAMPHKKNPILSENLVGLARLIRSGVIPIMENVTLWHERDISHSAVERVLAPEMHILLDFALNRLHNIMQNIKINTAQMRANLFQDEYSFLSHYILLQMLKAGISRTEAYQKIQIYSGSKGNLMLYLQQQTGKTYSEEEILQYYLQNVEQIFNDTFNPE